uniref:TIL domain-containing protein n=1 Tax=Anopheles minimus TaxID=112268 RepID=A0A182VXC1_9DIPT
MKIPLVFLSLVLSVVLNEVHGQNEILPFEPCFAWVKPIPKCPANERYTCCKPCIEPVCRRLFIRVKCPPCNPGCVCLNGYIRSIPNGSCIRTTACRRINILLPDLPIAFMKLHIAFLLLVAAVVLNEVQAQVLPVEPCLAWMKPQPKCPINERYTCCKTCFEQTCNTRNIAVKCAPPCYGGCICRNGYIRAIKNGKCVPIRACPIRPFPIIES